MLRTTRASSDIRLGSQGGSQTTLTSTFPTPGTVETAFLHHHRQFLRRRAIGRGQRHVDFHGAVVGDVDAVNQADLVDVGRNFRVVDGLERDHDLVGEPGDLGLRQRGRLSGRARAARPRRASQRWACRHSCETPLPGPWTWPRFDLILRVVKSEGRAAGSRDARTREQRRIDLDVEVFD